ncbi:alpha/beta hydrolase [Zhengella sp. ZM62]|uniref:alpha/beta hydrolase n=1 Tax=Zhengella sedimenti TaxID=3390035 RepID=UPI0039754A35
MPSSGAILAQVVGAALVCFTSVLAVPAPSLAEQDADAREVPFLTLRNRTDATEPGAIFSDERSSLSAGRCRVREVDLSVLAPLAQAAPAFIREEFLRVDSVSETDSAALLDSLQATAQGVAPVIYVHGYYIGFEKGCRRAVLLQENADLAGRFLWFSWPSDGALAYYTHDEADLYWSVPDLADAIVEMERRFGPGIVDVAGHSLGARGVVLALYEVASRNPDIRLDEIVLLAPDMDFGIFQRILPRIRPIAERITVYVTSGDRPLALSAQLHGYPRLGEAGNDVSTLSGVEVIDLSALPVESPTGHLYHIYSADVGRDLDQLLNGGLHAAERPHLVAAGPNLWVMQPGGETGPD